MTRRPILTHLGALAFVLGAPPSSSMAQPVTADRLGDVVVSVAIPTSNTMLTPGHTDQLGSKLLQVVTAAGLSGIGPDAGFVLSPFVTITERMRAGELRAMDIVKLEIAFAIRQQAQNITFSSTSTVVSGSGSSEAAAITNAIASLRTDDPKLRAFVDEGKRRIVSYYETNCTAVRADARGKAGVGQPEQAIALLMSVPREATTCQPKAADDAEKLFTDWQARDCAQRVRGARADAANRNYDEAIDKLQAVDPVSPCAKDADALITSIEERVAKTEDRSFQLRLKSLRSDRESITRTLTSPVRVLERRRELTKGVAVEFINRLPVRAHVPGRG